jgi:hypothetical protein
MEYNFPRWEVIHMFLSNDKIFECAKEITVSATTNATNLYLNKDTGAATAEFFESVFNKLKSMNEILKEEI